MTEGNWRVTDGNWRVADGNWRVTEGGSMVGSDRLNVPAIDNSSH